MIVLSEYRETCETCHDTGEVGDGYTREYETGMWVTWPCPDCTYPTRTSE